MSDINRLIVVAFTAWRKRNLPRGITVDHEHVFAFFKTLAPDGDMPIGSWEQVHGALRQAGVVPAAERHLWIGTKPRGL